MITVCGVYCKKECKAYDSECHGCNQIQGKVSWAKFYGDSVCPIYKCALEFGFDTCLECKKIPCSIWWNTKNPALSQIEFEKEIGHRIKNLKNFVKGKNE